MISIIVPIYNSEKYIDRCIDSIVNQSFQDLEIILVDDGSKDKSLSICQSWANSDNRIKIFSQPNQGVSTARNTGIAHATAPAIMFLDSDDYMKPQMCEVMLKKLIDNNADLVVCGTEENDGSFWKPNENITYSSIYDFKEDFVELLNKELLSPPWNKIYKKEKITSLFATDVSFGEDLIFNLSYIRNCQRISFITDCPHFHEKDNECSLARNFHENRLTNIEALQNAILEFDCGNNSGKLMNKYLKDITVHTKLLLSNHSIPLKRKFNILKEWKETAQMNCKDITSSSLKLKNKIYLYILKIGLWRLAYNIVQWKQ